jgi:NAD(P)-dependent dehydrogenase (short-subunit alcohol dehydrogenase family)
MVQLQYWLTGASSGIGRAVALLLAQQGHRVYVSARSATVLAELASAHPELLIPLPCDVADDAAMALVFQQLPAALQPQQLDGLIAGAGTCEYVDLPELDIGSLRRVMDVNHFGVANACKAALPLLQRAAADPVRGRPCIIGLCSMSVYTAFPRAEAYGAAKAAMRYFLDSLRCDIGHAIDVTIAYPGFVSTPMTASNDFPMPYCMSADDAAAHVVAALGAGKRSIAFPWQLHWLLKLASWLPALWYGALVPRLSRQRRAAVSTPAQTTTDSTTGTEP